MKHSTSQTLFAYWDEVRAGRSAPRRFDIEPSRISQILAETLILERLDFETYRFRLAGTRICDQFGMELRGEELFTFWHEDGDRIELERLLSAICRRCQVGLVVFEGWSKEDRRAEFEMLLLPLIHARGAIDRCLGAISMAQAEFWPHRAACSRFRLISTQLITRPHVCVEPAGEAQIVDSEVQIVDSIADPMSDPMSDPTGPSQQSPFSEEVRVARIVRSQRRQFRVYDGGLAGSPPRKD